jgi:predicted ATPase
MSIHKALDDLSKSIKALSKKDVTILKLRFPNYRNLKENSELPLDFPITVLLGRNGANKSSILHALYGSVRGNSLGDFWFETKLDSIPEKRNGLKQSVVHTYKDKDGNLVDCIKARAPRINPGDIDLDYWEPVKYSQKYGMTNRDRGERGTPVTMPVVHLDFRGELTAFDKYFYFPDPKHLEKRIKSAKETGNVRKYRKQDYIRSRSRVLKKEIAEKGTELSEQELNALKYILGRNYLSGKLLKHSLFHGHEGYTILFKTSNIGYSDAFAGSGESAAALLVHNIYQAKDNSLILLDEPETSLHPDAQRKMMQFIAHQAVRKSLQVVIATHSIYLAKDLPQAAIRVLSLNNEGTVSIMTNVSASEALHEIETIPAGKTIIVEDERAKFIVSSALKLMSSHVSKDFQVIVRPGGVSRIYSDIRAYVNAGRKDISIIFDGDQNPNSSLPKNSELPQGNDELDKLIKKFTCGNDEKGPELDLVTHDERVQYISFLRDFVDYIPDSTPEHFVWDDEAAQSILNIDLPDNIRNEEDYKLRLEKLAELHGIYDSDVIYKILANQVLTQDSDKKKKLLEVIEKIRCRVI